MSEFSTYPPMVDDEDWNALLDHGLVKGASYIIYKATGDIYKAVDGTTGKVYTQGTDASTVIQAAINALTEGHIILKDLDEPAGLTHKDKVILTSIYQGTITVKGNASARSVRLKPTQYGWLIYGPTVPTGVPTENALLWIEAPSADDTVGIMARNWTGTKNAIDVVNCPGAMGDGIFVYQMGPGLGVNILVKSDAGSAARAQKITDNRSDAVALDIVSDNVNLRLRSINDLAPLAHILQLTDKNGSTALWAVTQAGYLKLGNVSSLPTASASYRGMVIRVEGGAGVADKLYICMKSATDTYSWIQIASG